MVVHDRMCKDLSWDLRDYANGIGGPARPVPCPFALHLNFSASQLLCVSASLARRLFASQTHMHDVQDAEDSAPTLPLSYFCFR